MRRSVLLVFLLILALLALGLAGCGGNNTGVGPASVVKVTPSPASMNVGQVLQLSSQVNDAQGHPLAGESVTYTSNDATLVSTNTFGLLCAGSWDTTFIHCTPGGVGTATITAKASPSGLSTTVTIFVHQKADSIVVGELSPVPVALTCGVPAPAGSGCISQGAPAPNNTASYTAIACSNDPAICAPGAAPCQLPSNTLGPFSFGTANTAVATVAADTTNPDTVAVATAKGPGVTQITASLSGTTSLPAPFSTCVPKSIAIHLTGQPATTTVSMAKAATSQLVADVVDINGIAMTGVPLTWSSSITAAATVSAGLVTGVAPGTSNIVAICAPPGCNDSPSKQALFSNVVTATVTGTANAATVYATSSDAGTTTIVPINTSTNTAGTAINLPGGFSPPNSFIFARSGAKAFLGSDSGLITLDPVAGTATGISTVKGKVLAVSTAGDVIFMVDTTIPNTVYEYFPVQGSTTTYNIPGAVAADISPDLSRAYVVTSGGAVYELGGSVFNNLPSSGAAADVALLANYSFAYVSNPATDVFSTCTNTQAGSVGLASTLVEAAAKPVPAPNNTNLQMIALTGNQITQIDAAPGALGSPCPAIPSNTAQAYSFPSVAAFTPVQMFVTPDSSRAIVTASDVAKLLVYSVGTDAASGSATTIPLSAGATGAYTGGTTLDSSTVWVGVAGVNQVQGFTLSTGAPVAQVGVSFSPKLVAVRYQ